MNKEGRIKQAIAQMTKEIEREQASIEATRKRWADIEDEVILAVLKTREEALVNLRYHRDEFYKIIEEKTPE